MTYAFFVLLFASFWCYGIATLFKEEMILEKAGIWLDENLPEYFNKPLWKCPLCMASFHGTAIYAIFLMPVYYIWLWIPFCVCLCGLNYIVMNLFND